VVGVKWALALHRCDWWVTADAQGYGEIVGSVLPEWGSPRPRVFCPRDTVAHNKGKAFQASWAEDESRALFHDQIILPPMPESMPFYTDTKQTRWNKYGGCAALGLCWHLGATEVDVWGVDLAGDSDAAGQSLWWRDARRWAFERRIWNALVEGLEAAGMKINRKGQP